MSDADKIRVLAEQVMGWQVHARNTAHWVFPGEFKVQAFVDEWNPLTNIAHAWMIAEKLRIAIVPGDDEMGSWSARAPEQFDWCTAETAAQAICEAALATLGVTP